MEEKIIQTLQSLVAAIEANTEALYTLAHSQQEEGDQEFHSALSSLSDR